MNARYVILLSSLGAFGSSCVSDPPSSRSTLPRGIVERTLSHPTIAWETREAAGLLTHISPDAMLSDSAQSAAAQMYDVLEEARALIQAPEDRENVHVFITASVEEMEAATGSARCGFVDTAVRAAFVVITDELACSHRHELMHLVSVRAWGWPRPPLDWLSEGVATWFDTRDSLARFRSCIGEVEAVAAHLAKKDSLIPMTEVIDNHRAYNNKETGFRSTIQSPAFIGYLYDRWGLGAVETTWRGGTAGLARQTKMTLETILQEWRAHLLSTDDLQFAHNWTDILMNSCPG